MALIYYILWLTAWMALTGMVSLTGVISGLCLAAVLDLMTSRVRQRETASMLRTLPQMFMGFVRLMTCTMLLIKNILLGALGIVRLLLSREIELEPCLVHINPVKSGLGKNNAELAVLTLSPGVIPVNSLDNTGELTVYALNREAVRSLVKN